MTIAFVSDAIYPYYKGGKEKRLYELSTHLVALGHEVHIYTMHWWKGSETSRRENGVELHAICRRYELYHAGRRSIVEGIAFGIACLKLITASFDIIDVDHMPFFPIFSGWLVCLLRGKKLYGTWHEALSAREWVEYMGKGGYVAAAIEALSIRLPYAITAASTHTQQLLATKHQRTTRVNVVTPGLDVDRISNVKPVDAACDILYVGRFVKDKHVDLLIQAMDQVVKHHPEAKAVIIGQGVELSRLEKLIRQLKLEQHITILPPLAEATDVYGYMKRAKVFVLPSVREGFGIVALEALGCGTPVVTINSPANASKDLITPNKTGSIVDLEAKQLSDAILQWMQRDTSRLSIAHSVSGFDWQALARKQAALYAS